MRPLNNQLSPGSLSLLNIKAFDNSVPGELSLRYEIGNFNTAYNASNRTYPAIFNTLPIFFHSGPVFQDAVLNGVTVEALLLVVADHLRSRLGTSHACIEDQIALQGVEVAMHAQCNRSEVAHAALEPFQSIAV